MRARCHALGHRLARNFSSVRWSASQRRSHLIFAMAVRRRHPCCGHAQAVRADQFACRTAATPVLMAADSSLENTDLPESVRSLPNRQVRDAREDTIARHSRLIFCRRRACRLRDPGRPVRLRADRREPDDSRFDTGREDVRLKTPSRRFPPNRGCSDAR